MANVIVSSDVDTFMQAANQSEMRDALGLTGGAFELLHFRYTGTDQTVDADDSIPVSWGSAAIANTGAWEVEPVDGVVFGFVVPRDGYYQHSILIPVKGVDTGNAGIIIQENEVSLLYAEQVFEVSFPGGFVIQISPIVSHSANTDVQLIVTNQSSDAPFQIGRRNPGSRMEWIIHYLGAA